MKNPHCRQKYLRKYPSVSKSYWKYPYSLNYVSSKCDQKYVIKDIESCIKFSVFEIYFSSILFSKIRRLGDQKKIM